ncbi:MAG: hypothetical protein OEZ36_00140 [Spirochaetota bacterium]|nr:hypothetical protein [Spirochaetota bacterium]
MNKLFILLFVSVILTIGCQESKKIASDDALLKSDGSVVLGSEVAKELGNILDVNSGEALLKSDGSVVLGSKIVKELEQPLLVKVGRKNYCCHKNVYPRKCKVVQASSTFSAIGKCFKHWPAAPKTVHKGNCNH